jgi:hypothetical protein
VEVSISNACGNVSIISVSALAVCMHVPYTSCILVLCPRCPFFTRTRCLPSLLLNVSHVRVLCSNRKSADAASRDGAKH